MSEEFSFDIGEIELIVARLTGLAGFIGDHLDEIDRRVAAIADSGWEGRAATAYQEAHRLWASGAREFNEGVRDMSDAAKTAHESYSIALEANLKMTRG